MKEKMTIKKQMRFANYLKSIMQNENVSIDMFGNVFLYFPENIDYYLKANFSDDERIEIVFMDILYTDEKLNDEMRFETIAYFIYGALSGKIIHNNKYDKIIDDFDPNKDIDEKYIDICLQMASESLKHNPESPKINGGTGYMFEELDKYLKQIEI